MKIEDIAKAAHEVNRVYCVLLKDYSQAMWETAPAWQRKSAIAGVRAIVERTTNSPEEQHEAWMRQKEDSGWMCGPDKDAVKKTHPCMVPYADLPPEQQAKDSIFRAVVLGLIGRLDSESKQT